MMRTFTARRTECRGPRRSRGVAAVEFVISVPVLIVVMLAIAELGRAFMQYDALSYSVRNSARYVSEHAIDGTSGVINITSTVEDAAKQLVVYGSLAGDDDVVLPDFDTQLEDGTATIGVAPVDAFHIEVNAVYRYQPMIGDVLPTFVREAIRLDEIDLQVSARMRAIS